LFVIVTDFGLLVVFTAWFEKLIVPLGDNVTGDAPEPFKLAVCGLLLASSLTVRVPEDEPTAFGVKVTLIVQLLCACNGVAQLEAAKGPVVVMLVMFSATDWLLVRVMVLARLVVPTAWLGNCRPVGLSVTGCIPLPLKDTTCGLFEALSVIVNEPFLLPVVVGAKLTLTEQLPFGAMVAVPQLLH
jgi:hypothetical protein